MLAIDTLQAGYGHSQVLFDLSLPVAAGEVVALLGRNGMGKTTTIRAVMGLVPATAGTIRFADQDLAPLPPDARARLGLGLVPEGRQIFPTLTVAENLLATAANRLAACRSLDADPHLGPVPPSQRTPAANGRHPLAAASSRCWRSAERS